MKYILAIDQGTTSSRAIVFNENMDIVTIEQQEFRQIFPNSGWIEHDPVEIWQSVVTTAKNATHNLNISAIGIANQRETVVIWDKSTAAPIYNAIVWQDRRTSDLCNDLKNNDYEKEVSAITGLVLDPYFSATKIAWILDNVPGARSKAENGELLFGTIDSFLIFKLTEGKVHATDATNASRTMLYDIHNDCWSKKLCGMFNIPISMMPEVKDCAAHFGDAVLLNNTPILGVAGDQQAALIGQGCFEVGMMKSTYGTGCFAILNTGNTAIQSNNRLLTTIAYRFDNKITYAIEGSIFIAGAVVQWLRDGLGIINQASDAGDFAKKADDKQNIIIVPAFTGLGAPYWNPKCRGAIFGLSRNSGPQEFAKAALHSVGFQTRDLLEAIGADLPHNQTRILRVDGGMSASDYTMQFLANICELTVERPKTLETTAIGVAWLAGMKAEIFSNQDTFKNIYTVDKTFYPEQIDLKKYEQWKKAIHSVLNYT